MAAKEVKPIVVKDWQAGIAPSPHLGFQNMQNVENSLVPEILLLTRAATSKVTPTSTTVVNWFVQNKDQEASVFALTSGGSVYTSSVDTEGSTYQNWRKINGSVSGGTTNANGNGLEIWKDYLFVARNQNLDCLGPLGGTAVTGTISSVGTAVTGSGTSFTTAFTVGDLIVININSSTQQLRVVTAITDDTHLTLDAAFSPDVSGVTCVSIRWTLNIGTNAVGMVQLNDTHVHPLVAGQDDILYGAVGLDTTNRLGDKLFSLQQVAGKIFNPTDNTTYTANTSALQLPFPYRISCLEELGVNIMIGTQVGLATPTQNWVKLADIFPWDRKSATFNLPIRLFEQGVNSLLNINNQLYIQAGQYGKFYRFNGYFAFELFTFPTNTSIDNIDAQSYVYAQGMMYHKGKLFFGLNKAGASGVYSVKLDGTGLIMENTTSQGDTSSTTIIPALISLQDSLFLYLLGWRGTGSTPGIDAVGISGDGYNTSYNGFVDTQIYPIGSVLVPNTVYRGEILLDQVLKVNEGVKVYYRYNQSDSYTLLFTFDYATYGALRAKYFDMGQINGDQVQFRIALTGTTTSPRLRRVIFFLNEPL